MTPDDFKAGDRVTHPRNGAGTVERVADQTVFVTFDRKTKGRHWIGEYDALWFRTHPDWLRHVENV
jgi:hypothetical protein